MHPLGVSVIPLGVAVHPLGVSVNPLGVSVHPLGLSVNPLGVAVHPLRMSVHQLKVSIPVVSPRDIQQVREAKGDGFAACVSHPGRHQASQVYSHDLQLPIQTIHMLIIQVVR